MTSFRRRMRSFFRLDEARTPLDRVQVGVIVVVQFVFMGAIALSIYEQAWLSLFICVLALLTIWLPILLARNVRVHLPLEFLLALNVFIYGALFLGEVRGYYTRFWWWDVVLHAGSGMALAVIGFLVLYALYRAGRFRASPILISIFSFSFSLALGALWEIFEFATDAVTGSNMQKSGLVDTMWDLIVNAASAFLVGVFGYFYIRRHHREARGGVFDYLLGRMRRRGISAARR